MGISASQARLLTITARLTSNEYESQQISNAKMRLAIQSQQVSDEYISALNARQLQFVTYDDQGAAITQDLTANALYQYSDMKNQYAIINANGQLMVSSLDAKNFEKSANLEAFLNAYGVEKVYKTETLAENARKLNPDTLPEDGGVAEYLKIWEAALNSKKGETYIDSNGNELKSDEYYQKVKYNSYNNYMDALSEYDRVKALYDTGLEVDLNSVATKLAEAKADYSNSLSYDKWIQSQVAASDPELYKNSLKYFDVLEEFLMEAEDLGCDSVEEAFKYSDATKAQWYTNLWYKMNGASSDKSLQGANATNYSVLDPKLGSSKSWIQDALTQGVISLEYSAYSDSANLIENESKPFSVKLRGISWTPIEYGSCIDFTEVDDEAAVSKAEAEYEKKNNEISAKDKRYENKIKSLDIEHNTLQTEYESVKSAMSKNIDRSYKTFSG